MRKLTLSLAVMAALLPARAYTLGLGEIELNSALNQELNADIHVMSASQEDAEQLIVKLASREAFLRAGIDRPYLLQQLKFKVIEKDGKPYVKVYTKAPIREPYLNFLLEIDWPQGQLLREYTLLLDPPVYNTGVSQQAAAAASSGEAHPFISPTDAQVQPQSAPTAYAPQQQPATSAQSQAVAPTAQQAVITSDSGRSMSYQYQAIPQATPSTPDQYRVQQNDTLWSIANRMRPDSSVSVEQMMMALVRKNPEAFIQENINGVKRGYILRTPSREEATQISRQEAVAQAREHASLWREYSQAAKSAAPASALEAEEQPGVSGDAAPVRKVEGQLSIVGAGEADSQATGSNQDPTSELSRLRQQLAMAQEQLESERLEKEGLQSRLSELEDRVKRVIEMDDGELAQLQQDLQQSQQVDESAAADIMAPPMDEMPAEDMAADETPVDEMPAEDGLAEDMAAEETLTEESMPEEGMAEEAVPADDAVFVDEAAPVEDVTMQDPAVAEMAPAPVAEPVQAIEPPAFAQKKPRSFIESLMDDPKLLGMIGGGVAAVLLLLALLLRRLRGKKDEVEEELTDLDALDGDLAADALGDDMEATTEMMVDADTAEADMEATQVMTAADEAEDTVFDLNDKPAAAVEEEDKDDVIAEADVYLAYGIYQQAEDLLTNAIDQNPERDDYRMKLLETHYAAKNAPAFEQLAEDVQKRKGDDKAYWGRVVAMGSELVPASSLFSGADELLAGIDTDSLLPDKPATTDLELDAESADDSGGLGELGLGDDLGLGESLELPDEELDAEGVLDSNLDEDLGLGDDLDLGNTQEFEAAMSEVSSDIDTELDLAADLETPAADEGLDMEMDLADQLETISSEMGTGTAAESDTAELDLGDADLDLGDVDAADDSLDMDDEDFSLDFEASELGFEESDDNAEADAGEDVSLDADLDLGVDLDEAVAATDDEDIEMDLTGELGDLMGEEDAPAAEEDEGLDLSDDLDLGADLDADLDLGDALEEVAEADDVEVSLDLDTADLDVSADEISLDADLDLGDDIDLDMGDAMEASLEDDSDFDISELSEDVDEVSTKLDLARAYIDMGDNEGARSILEEVKVEGNDEQQQQAEELLKQAS